MQLAATAGQLPKQFVLRPQAEESQSFCKRIDDLTVQLQGKHAFPIIEQELEAEVRAFADHQRQAVDEVVSGLADSIDELIDGISSSIARQNGRIDEIERIRDCLTQAEVAPSLEETRYLLSAGIAGLRKLMEIEIDRQKELRSSHDEYTQRLRARLDLVERQSRTDSLTGVANRAGIERHVKAVLDHCRTNRSAYAFALMDLDGFKAINDRLGHQAGDAALVAFVQRLQAAVGMQAFVGRLGGDEFVVILAAEPDLLGLLLHRLNENLEQRPVMFEGRPLKLGCSFGVQPISPIVSFEDLHKRADAELYRAKEARRNGKAA